MYLASSSLFYGILLITIRLYCPFLMEDISFLPLFDAWSDKLLWVIVFSSCDIKSLTNIFHTSAYFQNNLPFSLFLL